MQRNTGLLFVLAAQASFALMSVAVTMLNSIDPPTTALKVCSFVLFCPFPLICLMIIS